MRQSISV